MSAFNYLLGLAYWSVGVLILNIESRKAKERKALIMNYKKLALSKP